MATLNDDIWKFSAICLKQESVVKEGDRICQFEIRPTMKAPLWIKLKWLFNHRVDFIEVDDLNLLDYASNQLTPSKDLLEKLQGLQNLVHLLI